MRRLPKHDGFQCHISENFRQRFKSGQHEKADIRTMASVAKPLPWRPDARVQRRIGAARQAISRKRVFNERTVAFVP
jgi:hypothetical protein